jgi:hypothetical protein
MIREHPGYLEGERLTREACRCPFILLAAADWLWPVEGICRGRSDGRLMVPPVPHYLHLCITESHELCEVYRARTLQASALQASPIPAESWPEGFGARPAGSGDPTAAGASG